MKNALVYLAFTFTFACGAEQANQHWKFPTYVEWVVQKFVAGAALERSLTYPTQSNITNMWEIFSKTGHNHLTPEDQK